MAKNKLGLALGSGGFRGIAHIGVLKVFEKNNIPIDYISGSSIGAVIGSFYASGLSASKLEKMALDYADNYSLISFEDSLRAFTVSIKTIIKRTGIFPDKWISTPKGLINGNAIYYYLKKYLGNIRFDQLNIPLSIMATDLISGRGVGFVNGNFPVREKTLNDTVFYRNEIIVDAVMASISIPVVFTPMLYDGKQLVDGGVKNSVPVDLLSINNCNPIVGVDLGVDYQDDNQIKDSLAAGIQALDIMRSENAKLNLEHYADITIRPDVKDVNIKNRKTVIAAIETGKQAAKEKITEIKSLLRK